MGLSPQYYDECTDDVLNLYAELEDRIIADVVRRIVKTGDITETAKWQIRQAQQMGLLYDDIIKDVAQYTSKTDSEVKKTFENAGVETVNNDNRIHLLAGNSPLDIRLSESMLQILNAVYKERLTDLKNLTGTTAITSQTAYYNACNSAFMMVSSGAFSYQQALRTVIQEVAENGTTVTYPSGHVDKLDVAVRRSLLTGIGLASRQISEENSRLCGCDLMEISAHSGARPSHAAWQGQIVSLSGRKGYLSKSDIGYGTGAGFGGWNCRHDWYPFYEGISSRNYSKKDLEKLNAKDIEYKGKMYSEYEISQMLRKKEREIRSLKREKTAYNTAITETSDKQLKAVFKSALTYTNSAIRDKSAEIKQFCADTGYKRDRFREQVGGKTSVGHGYGEFSKQNQKFNLKSGLTSAQSFYRIFNPVDAYTGESYNEPVFIKKFFHEINLIPQHLLKKAEIQLAGIYVNPKISGYLPKRKQLFISSTPNEGDIIHEIAHVIEDALDLYNTENFRKILLKGLENFQNRDIMNEKENYVEEFYYIQHEKFVTQYQGRIYVDKIFGSLDWDDYIDISLLHEYFSEGFKYFILYPDILKKKDASLYKFIEELCENDRY